MLQDLNARHVLEYKKTVEFLKYALGNRAAKPGNGKLSSVTTNFNKSVISASMMSANALHNQSRMSSGPSAIKARQRSLMQIRPTASTQSHISQLPPISGSAKSMNQASAELEQSLNKGRTKSVAGRSWKANQNLTGGKVQRRVSDIDNAALDVSIQPSNMRMKAPTQSSKLPHLMARKQAKNSVISSQRGNKKVAGSHMAMHQSQNDAMMMHQEQSPSTNEEGVMFIDGNSAPEFTQQTTESKDSPQ